MSALSRIGFIALFGFSLPLAAFAQDQAPPDDQAEVEGPQLDEIIVTAQKRAENLQDVPLSVSAIGGETLEKMNVTDFGEMGSLLPNTKFTTNGVKPNMRIRGLGSDNNRGFETSVGLYVDGFYFGRASYLEGAFLDLERMEVLRGPQGTLFGKNNVAGAINMTTRPATIDEWEVRLDALFGDFEHQRYRAVLNVPLIEDFAAFRIGGVYNDREGFMHNTTLNRQEIDKIRRQWRAKLRLTPLNDLTVDLAFHQAVYDREGIGFQPYILTDTTQAVYEPFDPALNDTFDYVTHEDAPGWYYVTFDVASLTATYDVGFADLIYLTSWSGLDTDSNLDADFGPSPLLVVHSDDRYTQWSHEIRIQTPVAEPGGFDLVAGLYAFGSTFDGTNFLRAITVDDTSIFLNQQLPQALQAYFAGIIPGTDFNYERIDATFDQQTNSYAAFGQASWKPQINFLGQDRWTLVGGLRFSYEEKSLDRIYDVSDNSVVFAIALGLSDYEAHLSRTEDNLSGKASVKYQATDDIMLYFTWAQGFKAGGYNAAAGMPEQLEFDTEDSVTLEVGMKSEWFRRAMTLNIGLFRTNFDNLQVNHFNGESVTVGNAASALSQGIEVEVAWTPVFGTYIAANFGWLDATYEKFDTAPCTAGDDRDACDLTGQRLQRAPEWTAGLMAFHVNPLGNLPFNLVIGGNAAYQSDSFSSNDNDRRAIQAEHVNLGGRLGLRADDEIWSFTIVGKNLLDERILQASTDIPLQAGSFSGGINDPRTFTAEFSVRW